VTAPGEALAAGIRRLRTERGLSLSQVAALLGVDRDILCRDGGILEPGQVAAVFGVTADELLAPCPHCKGCPPAGFACLRCRASSPLPDSPGGSRGAPGGPS
jgi:transcriptional regulator with XRE-family HTH domain